METQHHMPLFIAALKDDRELRQRLAMHLQKTEDGNVQSAVMAFARSEGYPLEENEFDLLHQNLKALLEREGRPLDETELQQISGGVVGAATYIFGLSLVQGVGEITGQNQDPEEKRQRYIAEKGNRERYLDPNRREFWTLF